LREITEPEPWVGWSADEGGTPVSDDHASVTAAPDPLSVAGLGSVGGFGQAKQIETLPPLNPAHETNLSPRTAEPRRVPLLVVGVTLLDLAAAASAVALAKAWWDAIHMSSFAHAVHLFELTHPRAGSWQSIVLAIVMCAIGAAMVTAPAVAAYNAWWGRRWSRVAGLLALAVSGLCRLMNPLAWIALPLTALGASALWLRPATRSFAAWERFRELPPPARPSDTPVIYGRLQRYR